MGNADDMPKPLRFSDFAEGEGPLDGKKVKIEDVLNLEILLLAYRMKESKYQKTSASDCLTLQFEYPDKPGEKYILFTGSSVLTDQIKKYEDKLPFFTTIKKIDRYFTLS
jgi:hypothetical protein